MAATNQFTVTLADTQPSPGGLTLFKIVLPRSIVTLGAETQSQSAQTDIPTD